jgi:hypothetical protein
MSKSFINKEFLVLLFCFLPAGFFLWRMLTISAVELGLQAPPFFLFKAFAYFVSLTNLFLNPIGIPVVIIPMFALRIICRVAKAQRAWQGFRPFSHEKTAILFPRVGSGGCASENIRLHGRI